MTFARSGPIRLDYGLCRYGQSKLMCRGPMRRLKGDYVTFLGGTETFGKFVERPYPALLDERLGATMINMAANNAGADAHGLDEDLLARASDGAACVIQITGAPYVSNRLYSVHPRRNDRFIMASPRLRESFPEFDFTEIAFVGHLMRRLREVAPERVAELEDELRRAWLARMKRMFDAIAAPKILLWIGEAAPPPIGGHIAGKRAPQIVDRGMIDVLRPSVEAYVEVVISPHARAAGTRGMLHSLMEKPAAQAVPNLRAHAEVADALEPTLSGWL
ncbi:DUF6473 family protein [Roseicyclus sp. F158]|uniref:DUF6473 family protein n=1 Tax=Tropicimonas omnivorans TaxID=3075590 RepID=A0ABU3DEU9_9RHOB|nr:DUF6473 family protein [Roseicyclus sp. F158]MDT0681657.1 DUF6473 family protein [Roseicyclus sp. F158]